MRTVLRVTLIASVLALLVVSCTHVPISASAQRFQEAPVLAATDPSVVTLLEKPPVSSYVSLGEVTVVIKGSRSELEVRRDPEIQAEIRKQAASLGATAVINISLIGGPSYSGNSEFGSGSVREVRAIAIRNAS